MTAEWGKPTPSGFTYMPPKDYEGVMKMRTTAEQADIENWDEPERPPHPTWEMLDMVTKQCGRAIRFSREEGIQQGLLDAMRIAHRAKPAPQTPLTFDGGRVRVRNLIQSAYHGRRYTEPRDDTP